MQLKMQSLQLEIIRLLPELNAPATPERILMSVNKIKNKIKNQNGR